MLCCKFFLVLSQRVTTKVTSLLLHMAISYSQKYIQALLCFLYIHTVIYCNAVSSHALLHVFPISNKSCCLLCLSAAAPHITLQFVLSTKHLRATVLVLHFSMDNKAFYSCYITFALLCFSFYFSVDNNKKHIRAMQFYLPYSRVIKLHQPFTNHNKFN